MQAMNEMWKLRTRVIKRTPPVTPSVEGRFTCPTCNGKKVRGRTSYYCAVCQRGGHEGCVTSVRIWTKLKSGSVFPMRGYVCAACMEID